MPQFIPITSITEVTAETISNLLFFIRMDLTYVLYTLGIQITVRPIPTATRNIFKIIDEVIGAFSLDNFEHI